MNGRVTGTLSYRQRIALPPTAVAEVFLEDVSRADAAARRLGQQRIEPAGQVPISFAIEYDSAAIDERFTYSVRARITVDDELWFTSTTSNPVLTGGSSDTVNILLEMVRSEAYAAGRPGGKIDFDIAILNEEGLYGPPDGLRALSYEFCIPAGDAYVREVQAIDPTAEMQPDTAGRIGCGDDEVLCIGNTQQAQFSEVLSRLAALDYVKRIDRVDFE